MKNEQNQEYPLVDVIAAGYEWICPECDLFHKMVGFPKHVIKTCAGCGLEVELDIPEHAMD